MKKFIPQGVVQMLHPKNIAQRMIPRPIFSDEFMKAMEGDKGYFNDFAVWSYNGSKNFDGNSLYDVMSFLKTPELCPILGSEPTLDVDVDEMKDLALGFYGKYFPELKQEATDILYYKHPLFIDSDKLVHVAVKFSQSIDARVGIPSDGSALELVAIIPQNANGARTLTHELSHALCQRWQNTMQLKRDGKEEEYSQKMGKIVFAQDIATEIESMIVERLFNEFLKEKGIYDESNIKNYEKLQRYATNKRMNYVLKMNDFIVGLDGDFSKSNMKKQYLLFELKGKTPAFTPTFRAYWSDVQKPCYAFRYIAGDIVSSVWFDKYKKQDKLGKQKMLDEYKDYLKHNDEISLHDACQKLVGKSFAQTAKDYYDINNLQKKQKNPARKVAAKAQALFFNK